jgi:hypothetical protein
VLPWTVEKHFCILSRALAQPVHEPAVLLNFLEYLALAARNAWPGKMSGLFGKVCTHLPQSVDGTAMFDAHMFVHQRGPAM